MNRFLSALAIVWLSSHSCLAQIGETKEELARRYGRPLPDKFPRRPSRYDKLLDEIYTFHPNNLNIIVYFKQGRAAVFQYMKKDRSQMTKDELSSILDVAVKKPQWVCISGNNGSDLRWRTRDSSAFAYYFQGLNSVHSLYEGPWYSVLVQTAPVDALYKEINREWYRSHSRRR